MLQLHRQAVEMAIIHREGVSSEPKGAALQLISKIKADPSLSDLPVILTTSEWTEDQCAQHQKSSDGANAYIYEPLTEVNLLSAVEGILGRTFPVLPEGQQHDLALEVGALPAAPAESETQDSPFELSLISLNDDVGSEESRQILAEFNLELPSFPAEETASEVVPSLVPESPPGPPAETGISLEVGFPERPSEAASDSEDVAAPDFKEPGFIPAGQSGGIEIQLSSSEAIDEHKGDESAVVGSSGSVELKPSLDLSLSASPPAFEDPPIPIEDPPAFSAPSIEFNSESLVADESLPAMTPDLPQYSPPEADAIPESRSETDPPSPPDLQAEQEMPYLYQRRVQPLIYGPLGDAVVPGGAAHAPDVETIKKYLLLREQDVAVLSAQLKESKHQAFALEKQLREERAKTAELFHTCQEQKKKIEDEDSRRASLIEKFEQESGELRFQLRTKVDQVKVVEAQVQQLGEEIAQLKERVRIDIRKIRVREKELENRLEMTRRDSEALLNSREAKMIELKRGLDLMEFNMDLLQNQYAKEKEVSAQLREKVGKLAQVVRIADGLLESSTPSGTKTLSSDRVGASDELKEKIS